MTDTPIPRALTSDATDPAFVALVGRIVISLDGEVQRDVTSYDMDAGYIIRAVHDYAGGLIVDGGVVRKERAEGVVHVWLNPEP